jgi:hypothetical protein
MSAVKQMWSHWMAAVREWAPPKSLHKPIAHWRGSRRVHRAVEGARQPRLSDLFAPVGGVPAGETGIRVLPLGAGVLEARG